MKGTWRVLRVILRTSILTVLIVAIVLSVITAVTAASINRLYPDEATRLAYETIVNRSPTTVLFQGRGYDVDQQGGILTQQMAILTLTLFPVLLAWVGVRFTRRMEDEGYFDILSAGTVSRLAPVSAGMFASLITALIAGAGCLIAMVALDFEVAGSAWYVLLLVLHMMAAATLGTLTAQLFRHRREAFYASSGIILALYLVRGWIDVQNYDATWTNPASWLAEARPFADQPVAWPYLVYVGLALVLGLATFWFASRRDLGGGVFSPAPGREQASPLLSNAGALIARLTFRTSLAIAIGGAVVTFVFGLFAEQTASDGHLDARLVLIIQLNALFAGAAAIASATTLSSEERAGRTGRVLSEPVSRCAWLLWGAFISLLWGLLVLVLTGAATGLGLSLSLDDWSHVGSSLTDALAYYPAIAFMACLALLLGALHPRLAVISWLPLAWAVVVTLRGDMLELSDTARHFSPLQWMNNVPLEAWDSTAALGMSGVALLLLLLGLILFRRRNLVAG